MPHRRKPIEVHLGEKPAHLLLDPVKSGRPWTTAAREQDLVKSTVLLDPVSDAFALELGMGNRSKGIRVALHMAKAALEQGADVPDAAV